MPSPLATVAFLSKKFAREFLEKVFNTTCFWTFNFFMCRRCWISTKALLQSCFLNRSGVKWRWLVMLVWHSQAWKGPLIATYCYPADVLKNLQVILVNRAYRRNSPGAVVVHLAYNPSFLPTASQDFPGFGLFSKIDWRSLGMALGARLKANQKVIVIGGACIKDLNLRTLAIWPF